MSKVSSSNGLEKRPRLRFPGFDEPLAKFEIGNACEQLKETIDPRTTPTEFYAEYSMPAFDNNRKVAKVQGKDMNSARKVMSKPCVLINKLNVRKKRIWLVDHPEKNAVSSTEFVPLSSTMMSLGYLNYVALTDRFTNYMLNCSSGSSNSQKRVTPDDILDYVITAPSLLEQERIARFLETIDSKIRAQEDLIELLKKYKRGVTAKLIAAIEEKYPVVKLGEYVTVMRGSSPRPIDAYLTNSEEGVRWIKIGDTQPDKLYITETKERIKPEGVKKSRRVYEGDLILSNSMSFGRPYILKVDGCIHDGWLLIRDKKHKFDKRFLCFYLASDSTLTQYKKYAAGSCVNNLNSELVASVEIGMPPIDQQIHVADILEKVDRQVQALSTMYSLLNRVRSALLQQLFI